MSRKGGKHTGRGGCEGSPDAWRPDCPGPRRRDPSARPRHARPVVADALGYCWVSRVSSAAMSRPPPRHDHQDRQTGHSHLEPLRRRGGHRRGGHHQLATVDYASPQVRNVMIVRVVGAQQVGSRSPLPILGERSGSQARTRAAFQATRHINVAMTTCPGGGRHRGVR